ncbi:MAG TPA: hypothetical protein VH857_05895 [Actinomycetes bacterium]|jgi:hypothetical protein|nr:hypothetical protein [Actinomycetes bacterium]
MSAVMNGGIASPAPGTTFGRLIARSRASGARRRIALANRRDVRVEGLQDLRVAGTSLALAGAESVVAGVQVRSADPDHDHDHDHVSVAERLPQELIVRDVTQQLTGRRPFSRPVVHRDRFTELVLEKRAVAADPPAPGRVPDARGVRVADADEGQRGGGGRAAGCPWSRPGASGPATPCGDQGGGERDGSEPCAPRHDRDGARWRGP